MMTLRLLGEVGKHKEQPLALSKHLLHVAHYDFTGCEQV